MLCKCGSGKIKPDLEDCSTSHVGNYPREAALRTCVRNQTALHLTTLIDFTTVYKSLPTIIKGLVHTKMKNSLRNLFDLFSFFIEVLNNARFTLFHAKYAKAP